MEERASPEPVHTQICSDLQTRFLLRRCATRGSEQAAEGAPQRRPTRPSHTDYLPLFQRGSAPVSMTTWSLVCSVGLDIQSGAGEGCGGATKRMHFPQQDAVLLPGAA
ncbi:uncharacterized protein V6R79_008183 [Siganus canaliculatus]